MNLARQIAKENRSVQLYSNYSTRKGFGNWKMQLLLSAQPSGKSAKFSNAKSSSKYRKNQPDDGGDEDTHDLLMDLASLKPSEWRKSPHWRPETMHMVDYHVHYREEM